MTKIERFSKELSIKACRGNKSAVKFIHTTTTINLEKIIIIHLNFDLTSPSQLSHTKHFTHISPTNKR